MIRQYLIISLQTIVWHKRNNKKVRLNYEVMCNIISKSKREFVIMQVLKDEVRKNILSAAKELFYEKGYNSATIRDIAKKAGITEGNVYRYFKSKENILAGIVRPAYEQIMEFIALSEQMIEKGEAYSFIKFRDIINDAIVQIAKSFRLELIILFKGAVGTQFEKTQEELTSLIEDRIYEGMLKKYQLEDSKAIFLSKIIAHAFLDSLIMVVSDVENSRELEKMIDWLNNYYFDH